MQDSIKILKEQNEYSTQVLHNMFGSSEDSKATDGMAVAYICDIWKPLRARMRNSQSGS